MPRVQLQSSPTGSRLPRKCEPGALEAATRAKTASQILADWAKLSGDPRIQIPKNQHNSGCFLNSSCTKSQSKPVSVSWLLTAAICIGLKAGQLREQVLNTTQLQIKHPPTQCFPRFILVYGGFPKLKEKLYSESPNHSKSTELSYDL